MVSLVYRLIILKFIQSGISVIALLSVISNIDIISETNPQFPTISFCIRSMNRLSSPQNSIHCSFDTLPCTYKDFEIKIINLTSIDKY